jgi:F-type H+-transporting ATPase subunit b
MEIISNVALISINETLIFQVISFLIFLFIIHRIMFRPLRKVMHDRETYIENVQNDIVAAQNQFEELTHQIRVQEKKVKNEAFKQKGQLEASGNQQAAEIMASTRKEINTLRAEAKKDVDAHISEARKHVQKESEDLARHIIETVLARSQHS